MKVNENKTSHLWNEAKVLVGGKSIILIVYIRKEITFQVNDLRFHLKKPRENDHVNSKAIKKKGNKKLILR